MSGPGAAPLALLTAAVPGCGGVFKASPEDFEVEELPAYQPSGEGEHLLVWVEKRGRTTPEVARALARHCGLDEKQVSWAGLKDRQAVTRQFLCLPARGAEEKLAAFALPGVRLCSWARHRNKLKGGHLHGNRFALVVREVRDEGALRESLALLAAGGLPNYYGAQRFGAAGDNAERGKRLLLAGGRHRDRFERKLWLSAYQSALFNRVASLRVAQGLLGRALKGDVLKKHPTGGEFLCEAPAVDQPRVEAFEVSPTGPMFGPRMRAPAGEPAAVEAAVLAEEGLGPEAFLAGGDETQGARRALRVPLSATAEPVPGGVRLGFELPAGSYATGVLRELLKGEGAEVPEDGR